MGSDTFHQTRLLKTSSNLASDIKFHPGVAFSPSVGWVQFFPALLSPTETHRPSGLRKCPGHGRAARCQLQDGFLLTKELSALALQVTAHRTEEAWGESSHTVHNHSSALTHKPPKEGSKSRFQTPVTSALIMDRCFSRIKKRWHSKKKKKSNCCHPSHITLRDCVRTSLFPPPSSASPCFSTKKVTSTTIFCHHCFWGVRNSEVEEQRGLSLRNVLHTGSFSRENEISFF